MANFTRQEVRAGLALAAQWFPEQAGRGATFVGGWGVDGQLDGFSCTNFILFVVWKGLYQQSSSTWP